MELIVLGGELPSKAIVVFHVESHLKAKLVVRCMRPALLTSPSDGDSSKYVRQGSSGKARSEETISVSEASVAANQPKPRRLGLALGPLPSQMRELAGPGHVGGAGVVLRVIPDSPASRAGLKEGDIVTLCDGEALDMDNPLVTLKKAACARPPRPIRLKIRRAPKSTAMMCVLDVE